MSNKKEPRSLLRKCVESVASLRKVKSSQGGAEVCYSPKGLYGSEPALRWERRELNRYCPSEQHKSLFIGVFGGLPT